MRAKNFLGLIFLIFTLFLPVLLFFSVKPDTAIYFVQSFLKENFGVTLYFLYFGIGLLASLLITNKFKFKGFQFIKRSALYFMLFLSVTIYLQGFYENCGTFGYLLYSIIHGISSQKAITLFLNTIIFSLATYFLFSSKDLIIFNTFKGFISFSKNMKIRIKDKASSIKSNLEKKKESYNVQLKNRIEPIENRSFTVENLEELKTSKIENNQSQKEFDQDEFKQKFEEVLDIDKKDPPKIITNRIEEETNVENEDFEESLLNEISESHSETSSVKPHETSSKIMDLSEINKIETSQAQEQEQMKQEIQEPISKTPEIQSNIITMEKPIQEVVAQPVAAPIIQEQVQTQVQQQDHPLLVKQPKEKISFENYQLPTEELLHKPIKISKISQEEMEESLKEQGEVLVKTLQDFNIKCEIDTIAIGPTVVRFEIKLAPGIRVSKVNSLIDNIALALATPSVRIEAPIPGKSAIGIELPKENAEIVNFADLVKSKKFKINKAPLTITLGKDIAGSAIVADLAKTPHLLVAGSTGSGKSVCMNTIIVSLLYRNHPDDLKFIMIDPKMVELAVYNDIPHLLTPVITDPKLASIVLNWAVDKMEERYLYLSKLGIRNISSYNEIVKKQAAGEIPPEKMKYGPDGEELEKMSYIVIVIDELADLMMVAAKDVEESICRLAQKARAIGIHLIIATQRPSVDVITGVIKSNLPSRIAFAVKSQIDSRTILDEKGAEKLLGRGDMLFSMIGDNRSKRVQGAFISDEEIEEIIDFIKSNSTPDYVDDIKSYIDQVLAFEENNKKGKKKKFSRPTKEMLENQAAGEDLDEMEFDGDELVDEAQRLVIESNSASIAMLQRKLKVGHNRAVDIMNELERRGIVGPHVDKKPREILVGKY